MANWVDAVQSGLLTLIIPALIMIGARLQRQDETIRRVVSLEERDDRLGERVSDSERNIAVLQAQYASILASLERIERYVERQQ